ncbi:unnamed protein product [Heligmosomoides polygyrus]|uniref:Nuclear apoptosis-inducing factor 1 n=1 Tax=Heligmosomoides polygyrus TaxID=6339 RepID=A0A183FLA5_HELPZ|nr:unnamed protein product [Heligmosomoides polygyrus]
MSKKSSTVDPPSKKISVISTNGCETPPRKKSSLKENISNLMKMPNFVLKREAAKKRWNQVCENLRLGRIKIAVTESKLFSPGEFKVAHTVHRVDGRPQSGDCSREDKVTVSASSLKDIQSSYLLIPFGV